MARDLPRRFLHPTPAAALGPTFAVLAIELCETDDYLLARTPDLNIKLRHRTNSLKMKSLLSTAPDRLECWRTDFDQKLPAPARLWDKTLLMLGCSLRSQELATTATVAQAEHALRRCAMPGIIVRVEKTRWLYGDAAARMEVAQFSIGQTGFGTVCLESENPAKVRDLIARLSADELGSPCNYITILQEMMASGGG